MNSTLAIALAFQAIRIALQFDRQLQERLPDIGCIFLPGAAASLCTFAQRLGFRHAGRVPEERIASILPSTVGNSSLDMMHLRSSRSRSP